jgi:hypothetical protein
VSAYGFCTVDHQYDLRNGTEVNNACCRVSQCNKASFTLKQTLWAVTNVMAVFFPVSGKSRPPAFTSCVKNGSATMIKWHWYSNIHIKQTLQLNSTGTDGYLQWN